MITVHMIGGLGNQLFQYAAARGLAHRLGTDIRLNLDGCGVPAPGLDASSHPRPFELMQFAISPVTIADAAQERDMRFRAWQADKLPAHLRVPLTKVYFEPRSAFD